MRLKVVWFSILLLFLANTTFPQEPEWLKKMKQIKLLSDSYEDVVKILGEPVEDGIEKDTSEYFDFREGRMSVSFEPGNCGDGMIEGWKVPKYTVIEVNFFPDEWIDPKKLNVNFKGFTAKSIHEGREGIEYVNDELGIDYTVKEGKIQDITFRPAKKYDYLRCKEEDVKQ